MTVEPSRDRRFDTHSRATVIGFCAVVASLVGGCTTFANKLANSILSNLESPQDEEWPPTAIPILPSSDTSTILGGNGAGLNCSIPSPVSALFFDSRDADTAAISLQMRQACVSHDYCYRHGNATYGYTQADCDYMLQEHAFRLCRQIFSDNFDTCETDAKKVLLGVWLFGSKAFHPAIPKDSGPPSTYFEYDPVPDSRRGFTVGRVLSTRAVMDDCGVQSTLYLFRIRPSGMRVSRVAWQRGSSGQCAPSSTNVRLPGNPELVTTAPRIEKDDAGEEWLVWWRRTGKENTFAGVLAISPERAPVTEWSQQFFGARDPAQPGVRRRDLDPLIVSGQPVPPAAGTDMVSLGGLSTQLAREGSGLSWVEVDLPEPPRIVAATSHVIEGDGVSKRFFYRNFSAPVMAVPDTDGQGGRLAWTSRGEGDAGDGYAESAVIHVGSYDAVPSGVDGASFDEERPVPGPAMHVVSTKVSNLSEKREPFAIVTVPEAGASMLLSLDAHLPDLLGPSRLVAREAPLSSSGSSDVELREVPFPGKTLDSTWMRRPPVLLAPAEKGKGSRILLSRLLAAKADSYGEIPTIEFALSERVPRGWSEPMVTSCTIVPSCEGDSGRCTNDREEFRRRFPTAQMIVANVNSDPAPDVIIVDEKHPDATVLLFGHYEDNRYRLIRDRRYLSGVEVECAPGFATSSKPT